ncbi:MAG TPA: hypothetical protein VGM92_03855, partial [Candidatus Kapabacteria bacterium]
MSANTLRQFRARPKRLNPKEYEAAKDAYLKKLEAVARFADSDSNREDRVRKGSEDAFYFARTYLSHYFETPSQAEYHPEIVAACQIEEQPQTITGPRGGAKSTI